MELEHLATNEKVVGSSPSVFTIKFQIFRFSIGLATYTADFLRGRLAGRTPDFESGNIGSNPFPEASIFPGVPQRLYGLVLETSVRRFESCCPDHFDFGF